MTFTVGDDVVSALHECLAQRLGEVDASLASCSVPAVPETPEEHYSPEEALRLCMVKYYVRLRKGTLSRDELDAYLLLLRFIRKACVSPDLRYIDALNIAYEALRAAKPSIPSADFERFCADYRLGLAAYIAFLDGGGLR